MKKRKKDFPDKHILYEAAVQCVDSDLDFGRRVFRARFGRSPKRIREDFCGTARLACRWVERHPSHEAWGVDIHAPTLRWGERHHVARLSPSARARLHLLHADVLEAETPPVDLVFALNFSFCVFRERAVLLRYFRRVREALAEEGLLILDLYGGTESMVEKTDAPRHIEEFVTPDGERIPDFDYVWEQARFNPIDHHTVCHIHFRVPGVGDMHRAFSYDWRLWTLPELRDLLAEAGFARADVYLHDFDENGDSDEIFRRRTEYENTDAWIAYVVGVKQ